MKIRIAIPNTVDIPRPSVEQNLVTEGRTAGKECVVSNKMPKKHFSTTGSKCSVQTASECPQRKDTGRRGVPVTTAQKKTCNVIDKARQDVVTVDVKSPTSEPASNVHFQFCRAQLGTSEAGTLPSVLEWMEQPHYSPPDTLWGGATVI